MTISDKADLYEAQPDRKRPEYGFILTLVCAALAIVVASAKFTPATLDSGIGNDVLVVGP